MSLAFERIDPWRVRLPRAGGMRTDGLVFADEKLFTSMGGEDALKQVANVAHLPGIVGPSMAMPDIHWGYGFPIGGVAAFDADEGVVSPGGVGYDINCGVRLLRSNLPREAVAGREKDLVHALFRGIPTGVGSRRRGEGVLDKKDEKAALVQGARWAIGRGWGWNSDLEYIEEGGAIAGADPDLVSDRARERGRPQAGTLGSGNHFVEVGYVETVFDETAAAVLGLEKGALTVIIHTGSRGLGYQVCDDFLKVMVRAAHKYGISLPDRQLCCAPLKSTEGREYLAAMAAAANFAFLNRQTIAHYVREAFEKTMKFTPREHGLSTVYDVCHNIAKMETHEWQGVKRRLCVHRKGATRAFPPGHPAVPAKYRAIGQPVIIPGDMGRYSYVLTGAAGSAEAFGSTCHGAGRQMSRTAAKASARGRRIGEELARKGITLEAEGMDTVLEEIPEAYKDVSDVVDVVQGAGLSKKVARLVPIGVIKG
jgi:tRNA-splicing ligase RtcB